MERDEFRSANFDSRLKGDAFSVSQKAQNPKEV